MSHMPTLGANPQPPLSKREIPQFADHHHRPVDSKEPISQPASDMSTSFLDQSTAMQRQNASFNTTVISRPNSTTPWSDGEHSTLPPLRQSRILSGDQQLLANPHHNTMTFDPTIISNTGPGVIGEQRSRCDRSLSKDSSNFMQFSKSTSTSQPSLSDSTANATHHSTSSLLTPAPTPSNGVASQQQLQYHQHWISPFTQTSFSSVMHIQRSATVEPPSSTTFTSTNSIDFESSIGLQRPQSGHVARPPSPLPRHIDRTLASSVQSIDHWFDHLNLGNRTTQSSNGHHHYHLHVEDRIHTRSMELDLSHHKSSAAASQFNAKLEEVTNWFYSQLTSEQQNRVIVQLQQHSSSHSCSNIASPKPMRLASAAAHGLPNGDGIDDEDYESNSWFGGNRLISQHHSIASSTPERSASSQNNDNSTDHSSPDQQSVMAHLYFQDIVAWLRHHRLHKYNSIFIDLCHSNTRQDILKMTQRDLESLGIAALGARRKIERLFLLIRNEKSS